MENRRQHYRFAFEPTRRLPIRLEAMNGRHFVEGRVVNLSVWGVCVRVDSPGMPEGDRWLGSVLLDPASAPLTVPMERIYAQDGTGVCCGFRFLRTLDLKAMEERERTLWKFLLEAQRQQRREALAGCQLTQDQLPLR